MSEILIRGMEMPECCGYCPFEYKKYCMAKPSLAVESADRHPRCPLVPAPPHGRLIDADALEVHDGWMNEDRERNVQQTHITFVYSNDIANAPTVIPAEEDE